MGQIIPDKEHNVKEAEIKTVEVKFDMQYSSKLKEPNQVAHSQE